MVFSFRLNTSTLQKRGSNMIDGEKKFVKVDPQVAGMDLQIITLWRVIADDSVVMDALMTENQELTKRNADLEAVIVALRESAKGKE